MSLTAYSAIVGFVGNIIDKVVPDKNAAVIAKQQVMAQISANEFKELEYAMSAITTEARSSDPWTSRARPSFLYVMYITILAGFPIAMIGVFFPLETQQAIINFKAWLAAIPENMWIMFGIGYTGYTAARSYDKKKA